MTDRVIPHQRIVVAAFLHDAGEVLLAKRSAAKRIAPGKYHLPGGHVEFGEHPADALTRELREELQAAIRIEEAIWAFSCVWDEFHTVGLVYRAALQGTRAELTWDVNDLEDCLWVPEHRLSEYLAADDHNYHAAVAGFERIRK